ncbi:MAG: GNAT family N-acetyltransferase [Thermotogaceae bacterium]|nr:GNAT family N-acetyltransferase [Thermotogaceae bacterium]
MKGIKTLLEISFVDFVNLVNEIFKDYAIPIKWDVINFKMDIRENSLLLDLSYVFFENKKPVGFVLTGIRKDRGRIDAMGVVKEKRGTGLAQKILQQAIEALKWKGAERIILEVASHDPRAIRFYQKNGFREIRNLYTMAISGDDLINKKSPNINFLSADPRWIHRAAIESQFMLSRKPNWQREPLTLLLSNGRYNMNRIYYKGHEGYIVWGETESGAFIVDISPLSEGKLYSKMLEESINKIFKNSTKSLITIASIPEDDPLYEAAVKVGFKNVFKQKEMCFRIPE